jgi:hypothetical protein
MKIVHIERLIDTGGVSSTPEWLKAKQDVIDNLGAHSGIFHLPTSLFPSFVSGCPSFR